MPISKEDVPNALAKEIKNAQELIEQANLDPSITEGFNEWEIQAAETFGNIHQYCERMGIGVHDLLRLLSNSEGIHVLEDGTLLNTERK